MEIPQKRKQLKPKEAVKPEFFYTVLPKTDKFAEK